MRVFVDASTNGSGGYVAHLKGILSSGAIPEDVSVTVACSPDMAVRLRSLDPGVELLVDPALSGSVWRQQFWRSHRLRELLKKHRADILFNPAGLLTTANDLRIPRMTMVRNLHPFSKHDVSRYGVSVTRLKLHLRRHIHSRALKQADAVIFPSQYSQELVCERTNIQHSTVIPHGVDDTFFREPRARPVDRKDQDIRLLYVSTVWLYKHQWHVLSAVEHLRRLLRFDLRLDFVGGGEPRAVKLLEEKIRALRHPLWVRYLLGIPYEKMPDVYKSADIFVFASSCECCPNILLEAMASGLSIACSKRRPMTDILRDGGVFFEPESPMSIADAIRYLIQNPQKRLQCARRAYSYAQEYSWARCARETFGFLREVLNLP